jgi:hypothetical protein
MHSYITVDRIAAQFLRAGVIVTFRNLSKSGNVQQNHDLANTPSRARTTNTRIVEFTPPRSVFSKNQRLQNEMKVGWQERALD